MDDALLVRGVERVGDLARDARAPRRAAPARSPMPLGQRVAFDQLEDERA